MAKGGSGAKKGGSGVGLVVLIIFIIIIGVAAYILMPRVSSLLNINEGTTRINVPTVTSTMRSSDGEYHSVQTRFSIELDRSVASSANARDLKSQIEEIMSTLEFEKMNGDGSMDYVKEQVGEGLKEYFDSDCLRAIYITAMQCDGEPFDETGNSQRDDMFRGLFDRIN